MAVIEGVERATVPVIDRREESSSLRSDTSITAPLS
jgi:hypothetical protein